MWKRILLAVDASEAGQVAASFVGAMARQTDALVWVIYVNELLPGGRGVAMSSDTSAARVVDEAVTTLIQCGVPADGEVRTAFCFDVAARIVDTATDFGAEVIVLGSRRSRRHPVGRLLSRFSGSGMRERVTDLTVLPTLTAPAPLAVGRQGVAAELFPVGLPERPPTGVR
jgi:nucleotide-binding universal stress UspA family protein